MKKTLVALAALTAAASYAQVTLTGNFDAGYRQTSYSNAPTKEASFITNNNASTSAIFIKAVEDLGGGMKATVFGEADFNPAKAALTNASTTNSGQAYTGAFFNSETYVGLSGGFGDLKLGVPNSYALYAANGSNPFGTALGGGYSDTFGRLGTNANVGISNHIGNASTARIVRNERAVVYETPVISGFKGILEYAAKNGVGTATVATSTTTGSSYASNNNGFQAFGLQYAQGPLNVIAWQGKISAGAVAASGTRAWETTGSPIGKLLANDTVKYTINSANYNLGATTLYAGMTSTKSSNVTAADGDVEDSKSTNFAIKHVMGNIDLLGNIVKRKSNLAADTSYVPNGNATLTGVGANYNLSKTSLVYLRHEIANNIVTIAPAAGGTNTYGKQTITAAGLKVAF